MDTLEQKRIDALAEFKKNFKYNKNNKKLATLVFETYWLGLGKGIEIGQREEVKNNCHFAED